jgi:hypothetical protein
MTFGVLELARVPMVEHDGSMTATMPRPSFRAVGARRSILVAVLSCYIRPIGMFGLEK